MKARLLIATTVPETLCTILAGQPRHLNKFFDVSLVTSPSNRVENLVESEEVPVYQVRMVRGINIWADIVSVFSMIRVLRKIRPHIVHSYTPKAGLICMLAAWICRVPLRVHTFTGLIFPTEIGYRQKLLIAVDKLICACATDVVPEGQGVKRDLQAFGVTRKDLKVIGHGNIAGVDVNYFSPNFRMTENSQTLRSSYGISPNDFVFCYVGRLNKDKGIKELYEAFINLPGEAQLLIVGEIDQTAPVSKDVLELCGKNPRVHMLGFQEDIRPALSIAHVLVLPSYREGFPNVLLQAGAMALPLIATDINGCNEIVEESTNGWLVPSRDVQALKTAMCIAMGTSAEELVEMGRLSRAQVTKKFDRRLHLSNMVSFYSELTASNRRNEMLS